jgi:hypothetical protein
VSEQLPGGTGQVIDISILFNLHQKRNAAPAQPVIDDRTFAKLPDGRIVLAFRGLDTGHPALFGIENTEFPDSYFLLEGSYENLGTISELNTMHPELSARIVESMVAAHTVDAITFVRMLDACIQGRSPSPALARETSIQQKST